MEINTEAFKRSQTQPQVAVALGIHPTHWYRLRANPALLPRCERKTLESIAAYLDWPVGRVLLAGGLVSLDDFKVLLGGDEFVLQGIAAIEAGPYGAGLVHPLREAPLDHQLLLAELYLSLGAESARSRRLDASRPAR